MNYSASNIKIKESTEFDFVNINLLAEQYSKPIQFVLRMFESCRLANVDPQYVIDRYLKGDKSIPMNVEVNNMHKIRLQEMRENSSLQSMFYK